MLRQRQAILLTKHLPVLGHVRHRVHREGGCEEERVHAKLGLGALRRLEKMLAPLWLICSA